MDPFELPAELPTGIEELAALATAAQAAFTGLRALVDAGETLTDEQLASLRSVVEANKTLESALAAATEAATARDEEIAALLESGTIADVAEEIVEIAAEDDVVDVEVLEPELVAAGKGVAKRTSYSPAATGRAPKPVPYIPRGTGDVSTVGFQMYPSMPQYKEGYVTYRDIAEAIDSVKQGHRVRGVGRDQGDGSANLGLFSLTRTDAAEIHDSHELVAAIKEATNVANLVGPSFDDTGALTAAGGWCAPSETLYDFCEVPLATDLISLPEITIRRGGVRWPNEPDLSAIFESFEFFFCEPELEALPPVVKECVEIPCPEDFTEIRLCVVGYCVEAGILQTQGWPELIEWFMRSLTQEHFRALSRRTILDMVAGSTPIAVTGLGVSASSSVLNTIELMAINLRLDKGLARGSIIEGVAPNWLHAVIRADFANQEGLDIKNVSDAQIDQWFTSRGIRFQFVADWQTRGVGQPGNLGTLQWPGSVRVLLYPAGTWFRALSNVIEFGISYPRELLQLNRYTRFFTEDAYRVAKRCDESLVVTIPICPNGGFGQQIAFACNTAASEVQTLTTTGVPTGGTFTLTFQGQTTTALAYNAAAATIQAALEALSNVNTGEIVAAGGALPTAVTLTFAGRYAGGDVPKITPNGALLTGGTNPTAVITVTTEGGS